VLPLGPERTELNVEYLFAPQTVADPAFDPAKIVVFTARVMAEDADVCELNQQGLRAVAHKRGVIMPEEYLIQQLHEWIEAHLRGA
jgi:Rieske 2Fe-2S family protein